LYILLILSTLRIEEDTFTT